MVYRNGPWIGSGGGEVVRATRILTIQTSLLGNSLAFEFVLFKIFLAFFDNETRGGVSLGSGFKTRAKLYARRR